MFTSLGEIQGMLAKAGASTVAVQYGGDRQPNGLAFVIQTDAGSVHYRLTVEVDGVLAALDRACEQRTAAGKRVIPTTWVTEHHARRVGWRILRDWIDAQLALVEIGMAKLDEIMLPYMLVDGDRTAYTVYREQLSLPKPNAAHRD